MLVERVRAHSLEIIMGYVAVFTAAVTAADGAAFGAGVFARSLQRVLTKKSGYRPQSNMHSPLAVRRPVRWSVRPQHGWSRGLFVSFRLQALVTATRTAASPAR
jgi:hypothetical protein